MSSDFGQKAFRGFKVGLTWAVLVNIVVFTYALIIQDYVVPWLGIFLAPWVFAGGLVFGFFKDPGKTQDGRGNNVFGWKFAKWAMIAFFVFSVGLMVYSIFVGPTKIN